MVTEHPRKGTRKGAREKAALAESASKVLERASKASAKAKRDAEALLAEVATLKRTIAKSFYAMGRALQKLSAPAMYGALGASSFDALLRDHRVMSDEHARKLVRIVEQLDERRALGLGGIEKAFAVVRLGEARKLTPRALATLVDEDPEVGGRPLSVTSVAAVETAIEDASRKPLRGAAREAADHAAQMAARVRDRLRALELRATVSVVGRSRVRMDADAATWRRFLG